MPKKILIGLITLISAGFIWWSSASLKAAILWCIGAVMIAAAVAQFHQARPPSAKKHTFFLHLLLATTFPGLTALLLYWFVDSAVGWGGYIYLSDLPIGKWVGLTSLWCPIVGLWLWNLIAIERTQRAIPERSRRTVYILCTALLFSVLCSLLSSTLFFLPLFLASIVFVVLLDLYAESDRTSLTWLLSWLFLMASFIAAVSFQRTINLDKIVFKNVLEEIRENGEPDKNRNYHLNIHWDKVKAEEAAKYIPENELDMKAGEERFLLLSNQLGWLAKTQDDQHFILVSRETRGYHPLLVLASLLFLSGLVFTLLLRGQAWMIGARVDDWQLPLCGPPSLQVRIQVYFFMLAFISFLLVGWFTYAFFQEMDSPMESWLETLVPLYAFLLLVAGAFGIFLADSISEPIVRIGQKLGNTTLQYNEPLAWPVNDEIGRLVANYNHMIAELDESVARLAASEREQAWREMAKQVAHEIKNPLTPMKLQLQQLVRLQKEDPQKALEWSNRVSKTLIEQIDGLSEIATAFGDFAQMPETNKAPVDGRNLLQSAYNLFHTAASNIDFHISLPDTPAMINVDAKQIQRVLNNLIRNAIQAIDDHPNGNIHLEVSEHGQEVWLAVKDNGSGIPEDIRKSVFEPRFTTKSSGMGLGLAMCKSIVEQSNGSLTFETETGQGTSFFVKLERFDEY